MEAFRPFMLQAVDLARKARFLTAPNPAVGAVLVKDGAVVAEGYHKGPGLPHAEVEVLADAAAKGVNPAECTLVVTLEPCRHHGKTPPCTDAVLAAGIRRVVVGTLDPNPEAGGGAELLRAVGVDVVVGVEEQICLDLIDDFVTWRTSDLPYTFLKLAGSLDGRIATRTGHSRWVSSEAARHEGHKLRRHMHALIVGGNTFYQDDPWLTCRLEGVECPNQPFAVVVTSRLPDADASYYLLRERAQSTVFWTTVAAAAGPKAVALRKLGVRVMGLPSQARANTRGHGMRAELNLEEGLRLLRSELDCRYVLCEGGGRLGLTMLEKNLIREFHLHLAPKILGDNEATPLFDGRSPLTMEDALNLRIAAVSPCDTDVILTFRPAAPAAASSTEVACSPA